MIFKIGIDMDGVLADFDGACSEPRDENGDPPEMFRVGFYRNLRVLPGARWAITELLKLPELDLNIATKPTTKTDYCASEKIGWLREHFPELVRKTHIVTDKLNLKFNFLIDDDRRWEAFPGFIHFNRHSPVSEWVSLVMMFTKITGRSIQTRQLLARLEAAHLSETTPAPHKA